MPADERVRLDDQQRVCPGLHPAGEQDQQRAIAAGEMGTFGCTVEYDELLPE